MIASKSVEAARRKTLQGGWKSDKEFPVANEKITLSLLAPEDSLPSAKAGGAILPFTQDRYLRDRWTTTWWPRQSGWQILGSPDTSMLYIYEEGDWLAARTAKLISTNRFYADQKMADNGTEQTMRVTSTRSVSTIFFFILLLASCSYLWLEGKKDSV